MSTFSERLIERLEPWQSPDLERYARALGSMFEPVEELAIEQGHDGAAGFVPPYGRVLNPLECPADALAFLGQMVGVAIPHGASEAEARALVLAEAGLARGTRGSMETAIKRVLGAEPFVIQERTAENGTADAYHFNVIVGVGLATAALYAAINSTKAAGLQYSVIEAKGTWLQATHLWSGVASGKKWPEAEGNT